MSTDNITLGELAKSFKDDSVNGICEYLNKKGFTIPKDPDYVLTESELKAIYPKVITPSKNNAEEKDSKSNLQQTNQSDKALSKDTSIKSDNNRIKTKKEKKGKKLIGIVKFYDSIKDFGFILTNSKGINGREENKNKLYSIYMCSRSFKNVFLPTDLMWVTFSIKGRGHRGYEAVNVEEMEATPETLTSAMMYRGDFSRIKGTDSHSGNYYDSDVICKVIDKICEEPNGEQIVTNTIVDYLSKRPQNQQSSIIKQLLSDHKLKVLLCPIILKAEYTSDIDFKNTSFNFLKEKISEEINNINSLEDIENLPKDIDIESVADKISEILQEKIISDEAATITWLKNHSSFQKYLRLDNNAIETLPLRIKLKEANLSDTWIKNFDAQWDNVREYVSNKMNDEERLKFVSTYFEGRDVDFVLNHPIVDILSSHLRDILDGTAKSVWQDPCKELMPQFFGFYISNNLEKINFYLSKNVLDIKDLLPQLRESLNKQIKSDSVGARELIRTVIDKGISIEELFPDNFSYCDEMLMELFVDTDNYEYLNEMQDFDSCNEWVASQSSGYVLLFIKYYGPLIEDEKESDTFLPSLGIDTIAKALKETDSSSQYKLLRYLPEDFIIKMLTKHFEGQKILDLYASEQWEKVKAQISYVAFDIESDGDDISQFAFCTEGSTKTYEDMEQLSSLAEVLEQKEIVVGHNISNWDLKILKDKRIQTNAFVWDTLVIEILLNPCRYAYSLRTKHSAKDDAELTEKLFWNQLYRLSTDQNLCSKLKTFLPDSINTILAKLQVPIFSKYFKKTAGNEDNFFHRIDTIDNGLKEDIEGIESNTNNEPVLIIAPQRLWSKIAELIHIQCLNTDEDINYWAISREKILAEPVQDTLQQTILLRFADFCCTPLVANLAQYLRIQFFSDELLWKYVSNKEERIKCADLRIINDSEALTKYKHIYLVGCELENRLNSYKLPNLLSPTDFWEEKIPIPMRLGGSNFSEVTNAERKSKLFVDVPQDAANVWVELIQGGKYTINYNFNVYKKLKNLHSNIGKEVEVKEIHWIEGEIKNDDVFLVRTKRYRKFDTRDKRVASTSRYRSVYWLYQLALLSQIHARVNGMPIIYILDNGLEIKEVELYARSRGFYVPEEGTLDRKLELIANSSNGMLIISQDLFFKIIEKKLYTAFCYVWDNMAVERHMIMWRNMTTELSVLNDGVDEKGENLNNGDSKDTYQSVLLALWPVYEYYNRFIREQNASSSMYIIEPFLEEYNQLAKVWGTKIFATSIQCNNNEDFNKSVIEAEKYFHDNQSSKIPQTTESIANAKDIILATLINKEGAQWSDIQKEVLPKILSKKENYLVSMPTGGGKSVLFQGPALYNSSYTNRLSLVVTPLKALMQDQVRELYEKGFYTNVDYLNGDRTYHETRSIYRKINSGELALLYVTPERFRSRQFLDALLTRMMHDHGLEYMIFDEAHCISQWGMEFRPEYLNVIKKCKEFEEKFPGGMCITMFSATVTDLIYKQINDTIPVVRLGEKKNYNPIRDHIGTKFQLVDNNIVARIDSIVNYIKNNHVDFTKSRMIVFCRTRRQCEELSIMLADELVKNNILSGDEGQDKVGFFHAGLDADDRNDTYNRFKGTENPIYILCATKAFGMGMDIPNIHYIVHLAPPNVLEDYLQEVGRAGRNEKDYKLAGFSSANPIPALCLYSKDDIKRAREQLLQNQLSWANLEDIRKTINVYISGIQPLAKTEKYPIVIPNNLWRSSNNDFEYTDFKLGEYWLERLGRIKMGYLAPAHIKITINPKKKVNTSSLNGEKSKNVKDVMDFLQGVSANQGSNTIQISLQEMAGNLSLHYSKLLDVLIFCKKKKYLTIDEDVRCRIANTRRDEVPYMLRHNNVELALQLIINAVSELLGENKTGVERMFSADDILKFLHTSSLDSLLKKITKTNRQGEEVTEQYMPWYDEENKNDNKGLSKAKNYKKDLLKKRYRQIYTLLDFVPDVTCRSYIDQNAREVKQSVLIDKTTWKKFVPEFEENCIRVLNYIYEQQQNNIELLNWAEAINSLALQDKGFSYFSDLLRFLGGMGYIACDSLLPTGVEVYTTDKSENQIVDEIDNEDPDYVCQHDFNEAIQIRNLRLCVMDALTKKIHSKNDFQELVSAYFSKTDANGFMELLGKYYSDDDEIWGSIRETAIKNAEAEMKDNPEQWAIYNESADNNVNVEAGPGSGKTHVLTMKCAKLIYRQHTPPSQILVLAYNRAVVVELKTRLAKLFASLGLSRSANQLNVYTFHAFAKRVCGKKLEGIDMQQWEKALLGTIVRTPMEVTKVFPDIRYILIDEFQDITQTRLDALLGLKKIYPRLSFFTIGDKDQSIYGFEREESMDPNYYYKQLYDKLNPKRMTMSINYRSYPKILEAASQFLPEGSMVPRPCPKNIKEEPKSPYSFVFYNTRVWIDDFENNIKTFRNRGINDVAVFFRTNDEVYNGYSQIRAMNIPGVRIRIQGASECELFRMREFFSVINWLKRNGDNVINFENDYTKNEIKNIITSWINNPNMVNWDAFYLDFAYTMVLDYLNFAQSDDEVHTYSQMADYIKDSLAEDNAQLYKLYDRYADERILQDKEMNVVLTTMHKAKGLEFEAVIITPSVASLPFSQKEDVDVTDPLTTDDEESIMEERRLLYVAFTRAKKYLIAYLGEREDAVMNMKRYEGNDAALGIKESKSGLSNYNIGYNAGYGFNANRNMAYSIKRNAPVIIRRTLHNRRRDGNEFYTYDIYCNGTIIGQLSTASNIRRAMEIEEIDCLGGFFISDIYYWTYEDTLRTDERNEQNGTPSNFAGNWCENAKRQGFVFIAGIAGYGQQQ